MGDDVGGGGPGALSVLAGATADRDVTEGPAVSPVATAGLAEVTGLGEVVVVIVAELGVGGVAARAWKLLLFWWWGTSRVLTRLGRPAVVAGVRRHFEVVRHTVLSVSDSRMWDGEGSWEKLGQKAFRNRG